MNRKILLMLTVLALVATACGSGEATASDGVASLDTETTVAAEADSSALTDDEAEAQLLAFSQCMRDEGIEMDDPTVDADGNVSFGAFREEVTEEEAQQGPPEGFRDAMQACEPELEGLQLGGGRGGFDPTELEDTFLEFAACMRDNGYEMDDPDFSAFGPGSGGEEGEGQPRGLFGTVDFDDPVFQEAQEACGDILAGFGPGGGPGGGRTAPSDG